MIATGLSFSSGVCVTAEPVKLAVEGIISKGFAWVAKALLEKP